jgi:hypothetical protein
MTNQLPVFKLRVLVNNNAATGGMVAREQETDAALSFLGDDDGIRFGSQFI